MLHPVAACRHRKTIQLCLWTAVLSCVAALFTVFPVGAIEHQLLTCHHCSAHFAATTPDQPDYRKYAPDKKIDVLNLKLDVIPDFVHHTVKGTATLRAKPIGKPLDQLTLDGVNLTVSRLTSTEPVADYQVTETGIEINFKKSIAPGKEFQIEITYSAEPRKGLYFRTPRNGYPRSETHLWTQGEPHEARHWFPCYDYPNEKFTSEIICHVPRGMTVLSNGKQISDKADATGLVAYHWRQSKPHVNYLITLVAGHFKKVEDKYKDIPLTFWTTPEDINEAQNSFRYTKNMMEFFEKEIGVPYPWDQYGQVCVHGFMWGGMENTSLTTLTRRTLFQSDTETIQSSDGLVAHELAHQWFGDFVTCKDWSQLWLNEGFATFYDALWHGHFFGPDEMNYQMYHNARGVLNQTNESRGMIWRHYGEATEMFNYLAYPKGSWILHMLRSQLGEDLYRRCIKTYLERHAFGIVETANLRSVIEELSGRSWDRFFDQWVTQIGTPTLDVKYQWDAKTKLARVTVRQTQKISSEHPLFQFPLTVRFKSAKDTRDHTITMLEKEEQFYVPLPAAPTIVRIDPSYTLLARINFQPANPLLYAQLADSTDMMGRLLAAERLGANKDQKTVANLQKALQTDAHYGVRTTAAQALRKIHTDESLSALIASTRQADARVRLAVIEGIAGFYNPKAFAALKTSARTEKNPAIIAGAIRELGRLDDNAARGLLVEFLKKHSFHERIAMGAITGIRNQGDSRLQEPLLTVLSDPKRTFSDRDFNRALDTLAYIARNDSNRDRVRRFLITHLNHPRDTIRVGAIKALGTLEDPRAIAALETFAGADEKTPEQSAAESAIKKLRDEKTPPEDLRKLRKEVLDLQKSSRDMKKAFDDLKKKLDAPKKK